MFLKNLLGKLRDSINAIECMSPKCA